MSLYQRLGQSEAITAVVQKFYQIMLADHRVAHYFANTDMQKQKSKQVAFITLVTGGPNLYQGADMKAAHCKHSIGHQEFDATWENLEQALHCFNVPAPEVNELKEIFYSVQSEIVNKVNTPQTSQKKLKTEKSVQGKCPFHQQQQSSKVQLNECPADSKLPQKKAEEQSLNDRLGGHSAVQLVVNKFYDFMLEDPRVRAYFANTDMEKQKSSQIQFISKVTGGPANYGGKDMKTAHFPYKIGHIEFDGTWQNLENAFGHFKVDSVLVNEVKEIFYSVEGEIVNSSGKEMPQKVQKSEGKPIQSEKQGAPESKPQQCPHKSISPQEYSQQQLMQCPHMSLKLTEIELNCMKLSQCQKRKLRQQIIHKQEEKKQIKKLSNNPYQKIYY